MRIPRIYLKQTLAADSEIVLDPRSTHYLTSVLRMKPGMTLIVFDGSGLEFHGTLKALGKKDGIVSLGEAADPCTESTLQTILGIGISRGERMDYAIQKSTELGVSVIQPLFTENCEVRLDDKRSGKRCEHWKQVSISACEQCGRVLPPEILMPLTLEQWLSELTCPVGFLLDRDESTALGELPSPDSVALLIGPEGGLSEKEKALAKDRGFSGLSLGRRTLRTETAPVAALSLFQYLWGN